MSNSRLFPVLASTELCIELLVQQNGLDLRASAEILGRDPGAVLRLFAKIAEEFPYADSRPERLEDCIAALGTQKLVCALGSPASVREEQAELFACAQHGLVIARMCRDVASSLGLNEEPSFLFGLLHGIGRGPCHLADGAITGDSSNVAKTAAAIARRHHLPGTLVEALDAIHRGDRESVWVAMLEAAHDLAAPHCSLQTGSPLQAADALRLGADSENCVRDRNGHSQTRAALS